MIFYIEDAALVKGLGACLERKATPSSP